MKLRLKESYDNSFWYDTIMSNYDRIRKAIEDIYTKATLYSGGITYCVYVQDNGIPIVVEEDEEYRLNPDEVYKVYEICQPEISEDNLIDTLLDGDRLDFLNYFYDFLPVDKRDEFEEMTDDWDNEDVNYYTLAEYDFDAYTDSVDAIKEYWEPIDGSNVIENVLYDLKY